MHCWYTLSITTDNYTGITHYPWARKGLDVTSVVTHDYNCSMENCCQSEHKYMLHVRFCNSNIQNNEVCLGAKCTSLTQNWMRDHSSSFAQNIITSTFENEWQIKGRINIVSNFFTFCGWGGGGQLGSKTASKCSLYLGHTFPRTWKFWG